MKIVIREPENLTTQEKILDFGKKMKAHKDKLAEYDKKFRDKLKEYMQKNDIDKLEDEELSITQAQDSISYKYDVNTVIEILGAEYLKPDNGKIEKEMRKIRGEFPQETFEKLNEASVKIPRKGNLIIRKK